MYVLATGLIITDFARGFAAFILHGGTLEGPTNYFEQFWIWSNLVRERLFVTMVFIADAVLVFRLYVVWGYKKYIVIGPIVLLIAEIAFASLSVWGQSISNPGATIQNFDIFTWAMVSFSIICSTNITVTALIAAHIWWYSHQASRFLGKPHSWKYFQAIVIIIESGSISGLTMFLILILYHTTLTSADFIYFPACQIAGIVPTMIIVRVGLGVSTENPTHSSTMTSLRFRSNHYSQGTRGRSEATLAVTVHKARSNH
ncbi:hypothetical protein GYMLUDRAFT_101304 [Collybiopsis luxurians FD-317 M1]|uniref:Unplaced genomic scaffold GYMLUscaffold_155, whole genome shotgun sequence n=1 Tax=Collybiopsis luxurians FD-317 M1 TaxID=944289 RepID=A0A0D0BYF9_9AGAR|nr:hypothetical protein GYMLUDRAFT_101304 [Collybiopsis luxurians FD-317 M1]